MPESDHLAIASYNIHKGVGTDRRRDLLRTSAVIAEIGADILALQEADRRFGTRAGLLDMEQLRKEVGLIPVPMDVSGPTHGWHGNVLLVKNALVEAVHQLTLPGLEPRGAIFTDLTLKGQPLRVVVAHLGLLAASRRAQARAILNHLDNLQHRPTLLLGDLNEWRRHKDSAIGLLMHRFVDAPILHSFPTRYPLLPLDRMMSLDAGSLHDVQVHDSPLARRASDHLPIKARLRLSALAKS